MAEKKNTAQAADEVVTDAAEKKEDAGGVTREEYERLLNRLAQLEKADAKTDTTSEESQKRREEREKENAKNRERVKTRLFRDGGKYNDAVFVCVNGKAIRVERGVDVEIPRSHAKVLENANKQVVAAAELERKEGGR